MNAKNHPIVIKKVRKGHHAHHGGAWKVAFADFVTAMMAFFLLMWLMGSTSKEEKAAISEYFLNPSIYEGASQAPSKESNLIQGKVGTSDNPVHVEAPVAAEQTGHEGPRETVPDEQALEDLAREMEKRRLQELLEELNAAIEQSQALQPFKDQLLLDITPEGLRIQILDKENRSMFDSGSSQLKSYTEAILEEIAQIINHVPNRISISGHTDATPYQGREDYSNWELSSDRANAARRILVRAGLEQDKIGRVVGLASSVLFDKADPYHPINRRISIIVLNRRTAEAIRRDEGLRAEHERHQEQGPHNAGRTQADTPSVPTIVLPQPVPQVEPGSMNTTAGIVSVPPGTAKR